MGKKKGKLYEHSEEAKEKISKSLSGRELSQSTKDKISKANKGKKRTKKQVEALRKMVKESWTKERREAMSKRRQGTKHSKETREKISKGNKGKVWSDEYKIRKSIAMSNSNHPNYAPFKVVAITPRGEKKEYKFYGVQGVKGPSMECVDKLGLSSAKLSSMKKGGTYVLTREYKNSKHQWPKGTKVTIEMLHKRKK